MDDSGQGWSLDHDDPRTLAGNHIEPPYGAPTTSISPVPRDKRRRPVAWIITTIILSLLVIAGGVTTGITYRTGKDWQERAAALDAELSTTKTSLRDSEKELKRVNEQIADLRREKGIVEAERDTFASLAFRTKLVANKLEQCADGIVDFVDRINKLPPFPDTTTINNLLTYGDGVIDFCFEAKDQNARLAEELDALAGV